MLTYSEKSTCVYHLCSLFCLCVLYVCCFFVIYLCVCVFFMSHLVVGTKENIEPFLLNNDTTCYLQNYSIFYSNCMKMDNPINFVSNNVKGLSTSKIKRLKIFLHLKDIIKNNGFIFLQETHSTKTSSNAYKEDFGKTITFSLAMVHPMPAVLQ